MTTDLVVLRAAPDSPAWTLATVVQLCERHPGPRRVVVISPPPACTRIMLGPGMSLDPTDEVVTTLETFGEVELTTVAGGPG